LDKFTNILNRVRASLWLVPALMTVMAGALAWLMLFSGFEFVKFEEGSAWWLFSGDARTARDLLSSLLSGMITMTSLVVSITMVVLSLAAGQLGPRLIGNFIQDRQIQIVLGLFMGTILYTLIVLRSVTDQLGPDAVPHIAITAASALTMLCLFALLFYVHKIARSIIADTVVKEVADELESAIAGAASDDDGAPDDADVAAGRFQLRSHASLDVSGYIQVIDYKLLASLAAKEDALIRMQVRPGHFVLRGGHHLELLSNQRVGDACIAELRSGFVIGAERTATQDLEYSVRQLVEIAVRALSTGINDPFTAIAVVNQLGAAIETILLRSPQPTTLRDATGDIRVIAQRSDIGGLVDAAFDSIRQAAMDNPAVLIRMADVLRQLAPAARSAAARGAILGQLAKLAETASEARLAQSDRDAIMSRIAIARAEFTRHESQEAVLVL